MTANINELFEGNNTESNGKRALPGTANLVQVAGNTVSAIMKSIESADDSLKDLVEESKIDTGAMDKLIDELADIASVDICFLKELSADDLEQMLKSQQSKRSRTKGKAMTMDNYKTMMNAAICERLIREALGKPKAASIQRRTSGTIEYTAEEIAAMSRDRNLVSRELRNVQSKKSILKHKEGFTESDERWIALNAAETQLKELRATLGPSTMDSTALQLKDVLNDVDVTTIKAADSKALLSRIMDMIK